MCDKIEWPRVKASPPWPLAVLSPSGLGGYPAVGGAAWTGIMIRRAGPTLREEWASDATEEKGHVETKIYLSDFLANQWRLGRENPFAIILV